MKDKIEYIMQINNDLKHITPSSGVSKIQQEKIDQVAKHFETIFMKMMVSNMTESLDKSFFGDTTGNHIYQGLYEDALSDKLSSGKGFGIGDKVKSYMLKKLGDANLKLYDVDQQLNDFDKMDPSNLSKNMPTSMLNRAMHHSNVIKTDTKPENYSKIISEASEKYSIDKDLLTAVIRA